MSELPRETGPDGSFQRQDAAFRRWVTADGSSGFPAEPGRYHLYVSLACPWASRTVIARKLKRLEGVVGMTVVDPIRDERGWAFTLEPDPNEGFLLLSEAYRRTDPTFEGRVTVPALWDTQEKTLVSNESADILRMLNAAFDAWGDAELDLYPEPLRAEIDEVNAFVYDRVNNGVYKTGFASTQAAYERAFDALFAALDELEARLSRRRFLVSDEVPTEADWRLFTTLVRFDPVYHGHFKCNLRRLVDYPNLWSYTRDLYQHPGVAETVDLDHIKRHYYVTHRRLNPSGVVPKGPDVDFAAVHDRHRFRGGRSAERS